MAYALAVCSRGRQCSDPTAPFPNPECLRVAESCPDLVFSPGATRTVEGLKACAETYRTLPCEQAKADQLPACVTPGTRSQGDACVFASQCSSLTCKNTGGCGQCALLVGQGESCLGDDVDCQVPLACNTDTYTCEPQEIVSKPIPGANEACMPGSLCQLGYYCKATGVDTGVCTPEPALGESCAGPVTCASGSYCRSDFVCTAMPGAGEACGADAFLGYPWACQEPLVCGSNAKCQPLPKKGEPCIVFSESTDRGRCELGLRCDLSATPPVCQGPGKPGASCTSSSECEALSTCLCPEAQPDCTTGMTCVATHFAGQSCGDGTAKCHAAFECLAGKCQARALQGLFTESCGAQ
jgi:hypothetical protein